MKDIGKLCTVLGVTFIFDLDIPWISQLRYVCKILDRFRHTQNQPVHMFAHIHFQKHEIPKKMIRASPYGISSPTRTHTVAHIYMSGVTLIMLENGYLPPPN